MIRKMTMCLLGLFFLPSLSMAFDLYVHSMKAPLFTSPSIGSERISEVVKGDKLMGVIEQENWYQVRYNEKTAWIFKLMVRKTPPVEGGTVNENQLEEISNKARRRPSAFASTAAARGLVDKRRRFGQDHVLDFEALEKMESYYPKDEDVERFILQGDDK